MDVENVVLEQQEYCVITGLRLKKLTARQSSGVCARLTGVLYVNHVRKGYARWPLWHDRVVIVTANRLVLTDEDGAVKRFHAIDALTSATIEAKSDRKVVMYLTLAGESDLLLSFGDRRQADVFVEVVRSVFETLPFAKFTAQYGSIHAVAKSVKEECSGTPGSSQASRPGGTSPKSPRSPRSIGQLSPRAVLHDNAADELSPHPTIQQQIESDRRELLGVTLGEVCPVTNLPYAAAPLPLHAPNLRVLFCGAVRKCKVGAETAQTARERTLFVTYQKLAVADPRGGGRVKRFHSLYDVHAVRFCKPRSSHMVVILFDMGGKSKDLLFFAEEEQAAALLAVVSTVRRVQKSKCAAKGLATTWAGILEIESDERLIVRSPAQYVRPQVTLQALRGTHRDVSSEYRRVTDVDRIGASRSSLQHERTRLWQRDQDNFMRSVDVSKAFFSPGYPHSPYDASTDTTNSPSTSPSLANQPLLLLDSQFNVSSDTMSNPPSHPDTPLHSCQQPQNNEAQYQLNIQLQAVRKKIEDLQCARKAHGDSLDQLVNKLKAALEQPAA
ncbi:hypothetical protein DIPPA_22407 [Diplonema papillatum]|nr:hypothetical protein DIPPA_22407 [Diplonema papillatum]